MSESLREWLDKELLDFEPVCKSFRRKQQKMYYIWMAVAVIGLVVLGFGVGYDWSYVVRVHLPIGIGIAVFIWLCVLLTSRSSSMKNVRKNFEKTLSSLSPSDQESFARQSFGKVDFINKLEDAFPARLLVGSDFWLYFRNVCHVYRVSDMVKLQAHEEKNTIRYKVGSTRVRQKIATGVSLEIEYREDTVSAKERSDRVYLNNWDQLREARTLLANYCPKSKTLWDEE